MLAELPLQVFHGGRAVFRFVPPYNQGKTRTAGIGLFHLVFQALIAAVLQYVKSSGTQSGGVVYGCFQTFFLLHDIYIGRGIGFQTAVFVHQKQQAFNTHGKTDCRRILAAQLAYQPVITAATANGSLCAEFVGRPFEHGQYEAAEKQLNWVLQNQQIPFVRALAIQRLAIVQLQQKKYDAALATLQMPVDAAFEALILETQGDVLYAQGKNKEALAVYEQALAKTVQDAPGLQLLQLKADELR